MIYETRASEPTRIPAEGRGHAAGGVADVSPDPVLPGLLQHHELSSL